MNIRDLQSPAIAGLTAMGGAETNLTLQATIALRVGLVPSEVVAIIEHAGALCRLRAIPGRPPGGPRSPRELIDIEAT